MTIDFAKLAEPFHANEIEWRIGRAGKKNDGAIWANAFAYVTNRAIQQRLDDVCGPANWRNEFTVPPNAAPGSAALCTIYIKIDGEWVGKSDGADNSEMEATKGGLSDSMKRAAVHWGIGRYLYDLEEGWVEIQEQKGKDTRYQPKSQKNDLPAFYWKPPQLPTWALPNPAVPPAVSAAVPPGSLTTGDKVPPPVSSYQPGLDQLAGYTKVLALVTFADWVKAERIAKRLNAQEYADLDSKIAAKACELPSNEKGFEAAEKLLRSLHHEMRISEGDYLQFCTKLADAKDAKLGAAA